jgi:hypothetical protein
MARVLAEKNPKQQRGKGYRTYWWVNGKQITTITINTLKLVGY